MDKSDFEAEYGHCFDFIPTLIFDDTGNVLDFTFTNIGDYDDLADEDEEDDDE